MTLIELKFVLAVAQTRNFRRAAEKCFVSQPALSSGIKKLEQELGVVIFERSRSEVTPTKIGEKLIAQAHVVVEESSRLKEMAKVGADPLSGAFKLGMIHSVGPYLLPQIIPVLRETTPTMPLEVEENLTANLETQLKNGVLDAAIIAMPFDLSGIQVEPLYDEEFNVVVPSNHRWASVSEIKADALAEEKVLLLNNGHCFSNQVVEACPELSSKGEILQGNSLETIRNMVASNLGITVMPASAVVSRYENPLIKVVPFASPAPSRRIAIAWRKSFVRIEAITQLVDAIKQVSQNCASRPDAIVNVKPQ